MEHPIFSKIENASKPDFGAILSNSFDLYKKVFSQGIIHTLVSIAISIPFILVVYIPILPAYIDMIQHAGDPYYQPTFFEDMSVPLIIGWVILVLLLSFIIQVFNFSIQGHFLKYMKNVDLGTNDEIGGFFTIAKAHYSKIIILSLSVMGISLLATLACYLPAFYVIVPIAMMTPIFIFNQDLSVSDIVKAGFKLGNKYWGWLFLIGLVVYIFSILVGVLACGIGILFTSFFGQVALYVTYRDTIGFEEDQTAQIE